MRFRVDQRVVFVTGKGGVGKSTVAAALARVEADRNGRSLLVEFDGADAAARALGDAKDGIRVEAVDYLESLAASIGWMLSSKLLGRLIVRQRTMRRVVQAVPAVRELVALDRVRALAEEAEGARVFVDLPATGHAVDWLRVPAAAERFLIAGPAAKLCRAIREQILTPEKSALVVVSTAEPVVASETRELCFRLQHELGRAPALVVVNRTPRRPEPNEVEHAAELAARDPAWAPLSSALSYDADLGVDATLALTALGGISASRIVEVPELYRDPAPREVARFFEGSA